MRFSQHGPSIPNDLLDARDTGEVVFLCGAGISIPAGLPDFFNLTIEVAHRLRVEPESTIGQLIETERKSRTTGSATYPKLIDKTATIPEDALAAVLKGIRANLELGAALETEISQVSLRLPTLYPENKPGVHHYTDSEEYYVNFARLFERLASFDPASARREYLQWEAIGQFFVALRIWALANPNIVTAAEVGYALRRLDRNTFWSSHHARELLWAARARWSSLSQRDRRAIESKILQGRAKFEFESDAEYTERRSSLTAERLIWMRDAGVTLSSATIARLPALKKANPHWRDSWAKEADASLESRTGWVKQETDSYTSC